LLLAAFSSLALSDKICSHTFENLAKGRLPNPQLLQLKSTGGGNAMAPTEVRTAARRKQTHAVINCQFASVTALREKPVYACLRLIACGVL
jgi:hypothetical protein